ncbi:unnamed protein product [Gongylonema pulchrum]|uniref:Palmitoyltransferase n=1 Tax=Gongylonema pulchrum TaxID=637853 RepID=A0A183EC71_9BILA|nr:unnamed protein product [Gongylonema pulchrum]
MHMCGQCKVLCLFRWDTNRSRCCFQVEQAATMSFRRFCRLITQSFPAAVTWLLIIVCTACFFYLLAPAIVAQLSAWGYVLCALDAVLFVLLMSNLYMAATMDPGVHPRGDENELSENDDLQIHAPRKVIINGFAVTQKWCCTCKFYRPPRTSHCAICDRADLLTRPNICSIVLMALCFLFAIPVFGLTGFHVFLIISGRTTHEQVGACLLFHLLIMSVAC